LVIKAMVEKYGSEKLLSTKYFDKIVFTNILQRSGAEKLTEQERELIMSDDLYKVMTTCMMKRIGFENGYGLKAVEA